MSLLTTFFNLIKPAKTDGVKVSDFNANMDTIDAEMHKPPLTVNGIAPDSTTRDLDLQEVPLAANLSSDIAQLNRGTFIERTSGGSSSIEDGYAALVSIKGNMIHTGYVAESLDMTVTPAEREEGADPITATIDRDTFVAYVDSSGTITLTYSTEWSANPENYGITVTGTPVSGDVITVVYVKENRGTITPATPSSFNSTGWNLYDNSNGIKAARVVKYSEDYGYMIGGTYSLLEFSETFSGSRSAVTVADGFFTVPSDGYVFVTGGDATTYILATWSDWVTGYQGTFQTYTDDEIDLSEVMVSFPYGLLAVGDVRDEINLNTQLAINRVQRLAYTAENLALVIASGVAYDADTNYIYAVLESETTTAITLDGAYTVSDHGIEFFEGTTVPVITEVLYGENLKDKLRTDVLTISAQSLDSTQKAQVQSNIGLVPTQATDKTTSGFVADARVIKTLNDQIVRIGLGTTRITTDAQTYINSLPTGHTNVGFAYNAPNILYASSTDCRVFKWDASNGVISANDSQGHNYVGSLSNGVLTWYDHISKRLSNTSSITSQIDALPSYTAFKGFIDSSGHQSDTGVPANSSYMVDAYVFSANYARLVLYNPTEKSKIYIKLKQAGTWDNNWTTYTLS